MAARLVFEYSKVSDGNMSDKYDINGLAGKNRKKWLAKSGIEEIKTVRLSLLGKTDFREVNSEDAGKVFEADALITCQIDVPLFIVVGDCFPVVFWEFNKNILALVHLGSAGIRGGLVNKVIELLSNKGIEKKNLKIKIGPGARKETYKFFKDEVIQKDDKNWQEFLETGEDGMTKINLVGYLKERIINAGINPNNIDDCGIDTISDTNYFSHYRAKRNGEKEERFGVVAMMRK